MTCFLEGIYIKGEGGEGKMRTEEETDDDDTLKAHNFAAMSTY